MDGIHQGREFLGNRVLVRVGERVEVKFHVRALPGSPFLLSGEVSKSIVFLIPCAAFAHAGLQGPWP
jgi:hypothetical protein